ncbi:MAG: DUF4230 domain-containing protein [Verrucomicrobia bacterium]|jgi:hypothetical protein|nr:DUF4230 domain-containing protein [Verrucomicrobiota bacterium]MBR4249772.1 DUF4230 domain-containing protein [Verrucomicrobiota bacterium]
MSSPSKNIRLVLALNVFWYTFMILLGWVLHRNEVVGYVFPLIILTLLGGAFLGMWMFNCLTRSALPVSIKENQFKKGSFIEHLRSDVRLVVARVSLCVVEEWKISRGLPLPPVLAEMPFLNILSRVRDETTLRMVARDNRVQYYLPVDKLIEENIQWDAITNKLTLFMPDLQLDEELVEVQTDPSKIWIMTEKGFYDRVMDWFSGETLRNQTLMRSKLRELVLQEARSPENLALARKNAAQELKLFAKALAERTGEVQVADVEVHFGEKILNQE